MKANFAGFDSLSSRLSQFPHFHKPLFGKIRLDNFMAAVTGADRKRMIFDFLKMTFFGQFFDELVPRLKAVETFELAGVFVK